MDIGLRKKKKPYNNPVGENFYLPRALSPRICISICINLTSNTKCAANIHFLGNSHTPRLGLLIESFHIYARTISKFIQRKIIQQIRKHVPEPQTVLGFGCGRNDGWFATIVGLLQFFIIGTFYPQPKFTGPTKPRAEYDKNKRHQTEQTTQDSK